MPGPIASDLHVDSLLTPIAVGFKNPLYVYGEFFPELGVKKQSDIIPKYDQSHWFRDAARVRARGSLSQGGGFTVDTTDTYYCNRRSFRAEIADEDRDNADEPWKLDQVTTEFVADKIDLAKEIYFADNFVKASVWGTDKTGGTDFTKWDDYGASQPLVDLAAYSDIIEGNTGMEATVFGLSKLVWTKLRWHPDLIDLIKHTQIPSITEAQVATFGGFAKVVVARSIKTTTVEGTAEASVTYSRVWGKHGLLLYVPATPMLMRPAAGYSFVWNRVPSAGKYIKRMRNEEREVDIIEGNTYFDMKKVVGNSGLFLSGAVN